MTEPGKCKSNNTNVHGLKECRCEIPNGDKNKFFLRGREDIFEPLPLEREFALSVIYNFKRDERLFKGN